MFMPDEIIVREVLVVVLAFYNTGIMVLDDDAYKTWLLQNWTKVQLPVALAIVSVTVITPVAVILRMWLLLPPHVAGAVTGIIVLCLFFAPNIWWNGASRSAFRLVPLGPGFDPTNAKLDELNNTFIGWGKRLAFSRVLRESAGNVSGGDAR